jgi:hypothetical protein
MCGDEFALEFNRILHSSQKKQHASSMSSKAVPEESGWGWTLSIEEKISGKQEEREFSEVACTCNLALGVLRSENHLHPRI